MKVSAMKVHPAAEVFPMLSDEELDELAADIKANGLLQPIIVKDGLLIDGRNRREACLRANVEPRFEELNGTDPVAYILATNVNRRHLTKGQRAMAVAKLYPEPEKRGRGNKKSSFNEDFVAAGYVSQARTVLRWLPEIADLVMAGTRPLNEAYQEAHRLKEQADSEPARLTKLQTQAPDLAKLVTEEQMTLLDAESAYEGRLEQARKARSAYLDILRGLEGETFAVFAAGKRRDHLIKHLTDVEDRARLRGILKRWIDNMTDTLEAINGDD